ncbi:hypothetical protein A3L12_04815 [Thermococcus sp. P6]|uniref:hypothetical protein n=1 Tax=Thermococcus sp. P6 TaxID=122420 RepID=UPI000B599FC8|nr:hypothetical protein [Thermococcus sp. P6]ASJ10666.1 hypothetical protein A3L12_04815 [Thermococcus sp. P6]
MRLRGLVVYLASLFLLYVSIRDVGRVLVFVSMSLSGLYVWAIVLWMVLRYPEEEYPGLIHIILGADLITIFASAFFIGVVKAIYLLMMLAALHTFVLLTDYGLCKGRLASNGESRIWRVTPLFLVMILGPFFMLGVYENNWGLAVGSLVAALGMYLLFVDLREEFSSGISLWG